MAKSNMQDTPREDSIAEYLITAINKDEKKQIAYNIESEDAASTVKFWISTGCIPLDIIISNRRDGGLPSGRMVMLSGSESSGKSLIIAHALANVQKIGGVAALIDSESALSKEFMQAVGVDLKNLIYIQTQDLVTAFKSVEKIHKAVIERNVQKPVLIAMDSLTALSLPEYIEAGPEVSGYEGAKNASYISSQLKKIANELGKENICLVYTSQLRSKIGAMPNEDQFSETCGNAPKFYASLHIRLKRRGRLGEKGSPYGIVVSAETLKNRLAPERRTAKLSIRYDRGIDYYQCIIDEASELGIIEGKAWKSYTANSGEVIKYQSNYSPLVEKGLINEIIDKIYEKRKFTYRDITKDQLTNNDMEEATSIIEDSE